MLMADELLRQRVATTMFDCALAAAEIARVRLAQHGIEEVAEELAGSLVRESRALALAAADNSLPITGEFTRSLAEAGLEPEGQHPIVILVYTAAGVKICKPRISGGSCVRFLQ